MSKDSNHPSEEAQSETALTPELRLKALHKSLGQVLWSDLKAHAQRNALFLFTGKESLVDVGMALATDDVDAVSSWAEAKTLQRPSRRQMAQWGDAPSTSFESVVVQPFVVARHKA